MRRIFCAIALLCVASQAYAAKLTLSEYSVLGTANNSTPPQIAAEPSITDQVVDFSGGATQSSAFSGGTKYVRVICDVRCAVKFGSNPTATTSNKALGADAAEYFGVQPGDKVSVVASP